MIVAEVFKVYLYADPLVALTDPNLEEAEDITSGILNVNIVEGTDLYEGPQQQIDTGQFTIVTRNPAMDPKINPNLKYNSAIKFYDERVGEFFRGYVTDIQVEYQRKDDPIITITGTDIFGAAQRVVVDQDTHDAIMALSTGSTWNGLTFSEFIPYMYDFTSKYLDVNALVAPGFPEPAGFWFDSSQAFGEQILGNLRFSPAKYIPQVGETYLDVMNKYAQTNLTSFSAKSEFGYDYINVSTFPKYDPNYWDPAIDPYVSYTDYDFSSDPADGKPYETILIDNGYNRVINQVDISNEYRFVDAGELKSESEGFTRTSAESIEDYAISRASISTIYPALEPGLSVASWANRYSQNIFQLTEFPGQEIQKITFDNARYEDVQNESSYSNYSLNQMIRIKHQINNDETIDRIYDIGGITHNISPDKWEMGFTLKPSASDFIFKLQGQIPTLQMNALTGDTNFNFTATLENLDPTKISQVTWALSATNANDIALLYPYINQGNMFKNGIARTGLTQTWNFDDDGVLAPYSFDPDSTYEAPTDNRYGGYGPGVWSVYAMIFFSAETRAMLVLQQELIVGTPEVEADFGWAQNTTNNFGQVSFVDTSVNNEVGEPDSYAWDFGDGNTSSERNPIHVYNPGPSDTEYDVSLTVFVYGEDEEKIYSTHTETVTLIQPEMTADFTWVANAQVVTFTNTSTNVGFEEPDAYLWDFGDGTTSTLKNPVHTFPVTDVNVSQSFSVTLTTRNIWEQTESVTKTVTTTALNESGTFPVRYIKFSIDEYQKAGNPGGSYHLTITPVMSVLKAVTSGTNANLAYIKPLIGFNDNSIPTLFWLSTDGANVQQSLGWEYFLTRDIQTNQRAYGLGAASKSLPASTYKKVRWELVVDIGTNTQLIKDIILRFEDLIDAGLPGQILTEDFYPRINIEFANVVTDYTPNPAGTFGPPTLNGNWVDVGYIKLDGGRMDPTQTAGVRTTATKSIFKMRPLPLNIPYFNYTFNDKIVSFTSVETADSYAWDFGDSTTSTDKDPVKTYSSYGTYTVTLAVTNGGIVTRTTTEPVIVQAPVI
jgi:PKD repeat protein